MTVHQVYTNEQFVDVEAGVLIISYGVLNPQNPTGFFGHALKVEIPLDRITEVAQFDAPEVQIFPVLVDEDEEPVEEPVEPETEPEA